MDAPVPEAVWKAQDSPPVLNQQDGVDVKSNGSLKGALEVLHNVVKEDTELQELVSPGAQIALT